MNVRLVSQVLRDFRSFPEARFDFPRSGVQLVRGRDPRKGTSSGTGKTSLLSGPAYALGVGPPTTLTSSWWSSSSQVDLVLDVGSELMVSRGTAGLHVGAVGGREAEELLRKYVGVPSVFRAITWRPQRQAGNFFSRTPGERHDFLLKLLDLTQIDVAADEARRTGELERQLEATVQRDLARIEGEPAPLPPAPPSEAPPGLDGDIAVLRSVLEQAETVNAGRAVVLRGLSDEAVQCQQLLAGLDRDVAEERRHAALAAGSCPTCGATVCVAPRDPTVLASLLGARAVLAEAAATIRARVADASAGGSEILVLRDMLRGLESSSTKIQRDRAVYDSTVATYSERLTQRTTRIRELSERLVAHGVRAAEHLDLHAFLRSWSSRYCAELLVDLSAATNTLLLQVPNVSAVSVDFDLLLRRKLPEILHRVLVDGVERADGLSGGQLAAVELAVDLALSKVIRGRIPMRPMWMILDEPFEGMGLADREAFLDSMMKHAEIEDFLYLVVDQHSREFGEMFVRSGIGVELVAGRSRIVTGEERATW